MALYRTYRPSTFAEVVGQEHVTDPLGHALDSGRINHAYLFSGPRGCGKTSSARILARSLNCVEGPTSTPCGVCSSCVALAPGGPGNLDVIELDAASHGGVDDTRELRDRAFYAPSESRYRVFIVDEAHMVTNAGFNALLKIVEEPPEHLIFVFATTEPEKVLPTIRSRTHHYPFRLLAPPVMRGLLENICAKEGVRVADDVYPLVIRAGGGSPRDSLSILDQLLAGAGEQGVTYDRALALLGVTDIALIDDAVDALAVADGAALFGVVEKVVDAGHDPRRFAVDLLERLRDLILLQAVPDAADRGLVEAPGDQLARMQGQIERLGPGGLTRFAEIVHTALGEMRGTTSPRLLLEVMCARMLLPTTSTDEAAVLQRLEQLEAGVGTVGRAPAGPAVAAGAGAASAPVAPVSAPVGDEPPPKYVRPSQRKAAEDAEAERKAAESAESEQAESDQVQAEHLAAEREAAQAQRAEAERVEAQRLEAERVETERLAAERVAAEQAETDRVAAEKAEADRAAAERAQAERAEADRVAAERAEAERQEADRAEAERKAAAERQEAERQARAEKEAADKEAADKAAAEKAAADKAAAEKEAAEKAAAAKVAAAEQAVPEPISADFDDDIPLPEEPFDEYEAPPDEPGLRASPRKAEPKPQAEPEPEPEPEAEAGLGLDSVQKRFQELRSAVRERSKSLEPMLSAAVVTDLQDGVVVLAHPVEVLVGRLSAPHAVTILREALLEVFGTELDVRTVHQSAAAVASAASAPAAKRSAPKKQTFSRPSRSQPKPESGAGEPSAPAPAPEPDPEPGPEPEPPRADEDIPDDERAEMVADAHNATPDARIDPDKMALELLQTELGARPLE
ncbi:DNA polymerase III subunit gamma and tau [Gordonia sp. NB41Y]|uniref:DNA polymerase III subunit gamma and tau n=1 Tax=Gordonia sp. NB41Y TaxID=875808 RepID=UPI0006B1F39C|nr:DNA polymerase III subunit gamma and tau [Gordonia sp. NB41Y]KOY49692.1 DNA polymerase III subunit gamma/tau [Gordonia sp. NB41Y]WLP92637.1 DNA polymerase III subunit gamma and tau [Gordonia sp. NB41Y]